MGIIDRYLLRIFLKTLLVLFLSTTGLYIMVDTTNNFEELLNYGKENGGFLKVLASYYGPRVLTFFDRSSSVLSMVAAMFVVSWLYRTNELTAILAGGIPKSRVVRPLIAASVLVSVLGVANREWAIPKLREQLIYNAQNWKGENARPLTATYDNQTEILLDGKSVIAAKRQIVEPKFVIPANLSSLSPRLVAARAIQMPEEGERPAGYLLEDVQGIANLAQRPNVVSRDQIVIFTPLENPDWLKPNQVFVASEVEFEQLAAGPSWHELASTLDLIRGLRRANVDFGASTRVRVHARILQPFVDMTLVLIGLPLVLRRAQRNIFMSVGIAMFAIASFFTITVACHGLGSIYLLSPALAAWLPLMIFIPLAALLSRGIWEP